MLLHERGMGLREPPLALRNWNLGPQILDRAGHLGQGLRAVLAAFLHDSCNIA